MFIIIPSKDRACQLELLIRSLEANWTFDNLKLHILYKASNEDFLAGYRKLKWDCRKNNNIVFIDEVDFCSQIKLYVSSGKSNNVGFMVDDGVLFRRPDIHPLEIEDVLENNQIITFSLRLGINTRIQNYLDNQLQPELQYNEMYRDVIGWRWNRYPANCNNSYIYSWDSHFYNKEWIYTRLENKIFTNPRSMEHQLSIDPALRDNTKPYMTACRQSSYVVNTVNKCQLEGPEAGVYYSYSLEDLNNSFLDGKQISLKSFDNYESNSCHTEIPLIFE